MAFSKVDEKYTSFADGGTANGSTGHDVVGINTTTANSGDVDTLIVGSDTTVTTPSGFTLVQSFVGNQGGYHFERVCTGGESATIRVKTTGDFNTTALFQRWRGCGARDVAVNSHIDSNGALSSNAINSGTLAAATELVIVASVMTDSVSAAPTLNTWSTGYTPGDGASSIGTGASCSAGFISHKNPAGTAAETPSVSWTPDNMRNRYTFLVSYQLGTGVDVTVQTVSGGAGAGSSKTTQATDQIKQTVSGGASAGSSRTTQATDQVKQTVSGGAGAGSSQDTQATDQVKQTVSGGASAGSSRTTSAIDQVKQTVSGGIAAGSGQDSQATDQVRQTVSGGAGAGSSRTSAPGDVIIQTVSGGAGAGSSRTTASSSTGVVHDKMVMPVLLVAQACMETEVNKVAKPPASFQIRPGASFVAYPDSTSDECCSGIAWVRPGAMWETDNFPVQRTGADKIEPAYYAVQIELGVLRCLPTIGDNPADGPDAKPTKAQWLEATQEAMDDAAALRRVVCCLREIYHVDAVVAGQINPLENEANCAGTSLVITMRVPACDCFDAG